MNKNEITQVIEDQKQKTPHENMIERCMLAAISKDYKSKGVKIISGIRRCGKSTLLSQLRNRNKQSDYYMNFDDERLAGFKIDDFQKMIEMFIEMFGSQNTYYFDEIQNIKGWERFVRRLHDSGKQVYITGSNASMLSRELGTHLTGRCKHFELYPFSFGEYLTAKKASHEINNLKGSDKKSVMRRYIKRYLKDGGIPEYVNNGDIGHLKSLYEGVVYRDILTRYNLFNERQVKELICYVCGNIAKEMSYNSLKNVVGIASPITIREYFHYLENAYMVFLVNRYDRSLKRQMFSPKKVYCIDTALAGHIGFRYEDEESRMFENCIFIELKRRGHEVYYYKGKQECDFLLRKGNTITEAIQVSLSIENQKTREREINGLIEAMKEHSVEKGTIITLDEEETVEQRINGKKYVICVVSAGIWLLNV